MSSKEPTTEPLVARDATYYRAPDSLRARIRASVEADARAGSGRRWDWRWGGMALAAGVAGVLSWNVAMMQARGGGDEERVAREVESAHIRSLMVESHLNDVASTDQHTVKPWFQGRLDFAPSVFDLPASGFTLVGGRLDYVDGRAAAAVTYRHRLHVVNLFQWPSQGPDSPPALASRHGYSLVSWKRRGLEYRMISDTAGADLLEFARKLAAG